MQKRHLRWLAPPAVAAVAASLLVPTGVASAASPPQIISLSSATDSVSIKRVYPTCPQGRSVISVGGYVTGAGASPIKVHSLAWGPLQATVVAEEDPAGYAGNWTLTGTVTCASAAGHEVIMTTGSTAEDTSTATQACPAGKQALSASGLSYGDDSVMAAAYPLSNPPGARAVAYGRYRADGTPVSNSVAVTCAGPTPGYEVRFVTSAGDSTSGKTVTAQCPTGKVAYGAGYAINGGDGKVVLTALRQNPTSVGVTARENAAGHGSNWVVSAYAICAEAG